LMVSELVRSPVAMTVEIDLERLSCFASHN
jgi:hypothetical protein